MSLDPRQKRWQYVLTDAVVECYVPALKTATSVAEQTFVGFDRMDMRIMLAQKIRGRAKIGVPSRMITFLLGDLPSSWQDRS
jgi:hypothetical protein